MTKRIILGTLLLCATTVAGALTAALRRRLTGKHSTSRGTARVGDLCVPSRHRISCIARSCKALPEFMDRSEHRPPLIPTAAPRPTPAT